MWLTILTLLGCSGDPSPPPDVPPAPAPEEADAIEEADVVEDVVVRMREIGPAGVAPSQLVVHVDPPLFTERSGAAPEGTALDFAPEVDGELRIADTDTLIFTPAAGFAPGTDYTATLSVISDGEGSFEGPWTREFTTPDFALVRTTVHKRDLQTGETELDLVFSAAADPAQVARRVTLSIDDHDLRAVDVAAGDAANEVRIWLKDAALRGEGTLKTALQSGVPWRGDDAVVAASARTTTALSAGVPVEILHVSVKEGVSGFYVDVVCKDEAVESERYWWDPDTWDGWWVSSRCLPTAESLARSIRFTPPVDVTLSSAPGGFRLFGDFDKGHYDLEIGAGMETEDGGMVLSSYEVGLGIPARSPMVRFAQQGRYLPRSAWDQLAVRHRNVAEAELVVRHVPPQNLIFWLSGEEDVGERTSDVILRQTVALPRPEDVDQTTWLDVKSMLPEVGQGVYELELTASGQASDTARLLLSDLQLVAKRSGDSSTVHVWVLETHTGWPEAQVSVKLVRPSGRVIDQCTTPSSGDCTLHIPADGTDDNTPLALIATKADDLTYLRFADLEVSTEGDVLGVPYQTTAPYSAAVHTERGVYRPGETAQVTVIVRGEDHRAPEAGLPVVLKLYDPRNRELKRKVLPSNAVGMVTADFPFADFATTGRYRLVASVGETALGETSLAVEEFVPERMRVAVELLGEGITAEQSAQAEVSAQWLFGGSAAESRVELTCTARAQRFVPAQHSTFTYGLAFVDRDRPLPVTVGVIEGVLDEDGGATLRCPRADRAGAALGGGVLVATAAVFEGDSGRTSNASASQPLHPAAHYIGLRSSTDKLTAGQTATIDGVVVDWEGRLHTGLSEVDVSIFELQEEIGWTWDEDTGSSARQRILRRALIAEQTVPVQGGKLSLEVQAESDVAGFLVVASAGGAVTELHIDGDGHRYWWSGDSQVDQTPRPRRPAPLEAQVPSTIEVGQSAQATVVAPYGGQLLWTVETDEVLASELVEVQAGEVSWPFSVQSFTPNVYISALLIKDPHLESPTSYLPDRAWGAAPVEVVPAAYTQKVTLTVPEEVRPNSPLTVQIAVEPAAGEGPIMATIAAVDEGILSLTGFESPDPASAIFAQRALGVSTFETIGWSLTDGGGTARTGGDGDSGGVGRVQMVKPVALWSGLVTLGPDGKGTVTFDVPSYRGALSVMAITASSQRIGSADAEVTVRDPLVLQATLPRFLVQEDLAQVPVFVSNMTGRDGEVTLSLVAESLTDDEAVSVVGSTTERIRLAEGESGSVIFQVQSLRAPGAARLTVTATANGETSTESLELPLIPAEPEARHHAVIALDAGTTDLTDAVGDWVPGSDHSTVWLTASPYGSAFTHLRHLIRYPYGCIEQTTSSTRPLLFVSSLLETMEPGLVSGGGVDAMVQHGIARIASMQTPSGGFAYWPGGDHPNLWGTAYATHLLLDARDAGYALPDGLLDEAVSWLRDEVGSTSERRGGAYGHYVIARAGRGLPADAQRALEGLSDDAAESRYLLMAAMYAAGDRQHEAALRSPDLTAIDSARINDWSYYSDRRRRALTLNIFEELFPGDAAGEALAALVADSIDDRPSWWYTTQELAWAVSGLGRRVTGKSAALPEAALLVDGQARSPRRTDAGQVWDVRGASALASLAVRLPEGTAYLHVITDGAAAAPMPTGGEGLAVSRELLTASGKPVVSDRHELGALLYVRLTIENTTRESIQNIALTDRIPAGMEIENPRLGRGLLPAWAESYSMWDKEHMNLRDDRLEVFGTLRRGEKRTVLYAVRAVTAGTFTQPPISAEAMYNPDQWAREAGGEVEIVGPWAAAM